MSSKLDARMNQLASKHSAAAWFIFAIVNSTIAYALWYYHDNVHPIIGFAMVLFEIFFIMRAIGSLLLVYRVSNHADVR